ncbi:MAG: hypothetical protein QM784_36490 [Polyangiaceae bacterium]
MALMFGTGLAACGNTDGTASTTEKPGTSQRLDSVKTGSRCGEGELPNGPPFPPEATHPDSDAIAMTDDSISAFATRVEDVDFGDYVDAKWMDEQQALGPAEGNSNDVVSLGEGGRITLSFAKPISDSDGPDLCVFENSFSDRISSSSPSSKWPRARTSSCDSPRLLTLRKQWTAMAPWIQR